MKISPMNDKQNEQKGTGFPSTEPVPFWVEREAVRHLFLSIQIISHVVAVKLLDDPDDNRPIVQCFFFQNLMLNMAAVQLLFVVFVFCLHFIHRQLMGNIILQLEMNGLVQTSGLNEDIRELL